MSKLILASVSKRRQEILKNTGYEFDIIVPDVDEDSLGELAPSKLVVELAKLKACEVISKAPKDAVILAADTVVFFKGTVLGKPKDKTHAQSMLEALSGNMHHVYTGVCICDRANNNEISFCEKAAVHMSPMKKEEIDAYIETGQPMDKAGSYGIQGPGGLFVSGIEGDFFAVCGLPVNRVYNALKDMGIYPKMKNTDYI
ncbi:MAG: Maf family protein [Defluviitaleaceae bacterium]|nr:Maf family protein [Defluviitaleaceae bacterium]